MLSQVINLNKIMSVKFGPQLRYFLKKIIYLKVGLFLLHIHIQRLIIWLIDWLIERGEQRYFDWWLTSKMSATTRAWAKPESRAGNSIWVSFLGLGAHVLGHLLLFFPGMLAERWIGNGVVRIQIGTHMGCLHYR